MFYQNVEVTVKQNLDDGRVLIEVPSEIQNEYGYEEAPFEQIVLKTDLRETKFNYPKEEKALRAAMEKERAQMMAGVQAATRDLVEQKKQLEADILKLGDFTAVFRFLDPEYEWVATVEYNSFRVRHRDKLLARDSDRDPKFAAIAVRGTPQKPLTTWVCRYSDGSGHSSSVRCYFFKTENEAYEFLTPMVEKRLKDLQSVSGLKEFKVRTPLIEAALAKQKKNDIKKIRAHADYLSKQLENQNKRLQDAILEGTEGDDN